MLSVEVIASNTFYDNKGNPLPKGFVFETAMTEAEVAKVVGLRLSGKTDGEIIVAVDDKGEPENKGEPEGKAEDQKGEDQKGQEDVKIDRAALEESAKTLGVKFTKETTDLDLLDLVKTKLGE